MASKPPELPNITDWVYERGQVLATLLQVQEATHEIKKDTQEIREHFMRIINDMQRTCAVERVLKSKIRDDLDRFEVEIKKDLDKAEVDIKKDLVRVEGVAYKNRKVLTQISPAIRIMTWVGVALGLSIIGLIWALITGQAAISFL